MKTQQQHAESARRKLADRSEGFNFLLSQPHQPTAEEIQKLRAKRPALWNAYPTPHHLPPMKTPDTTAALAALIDAAARQLDTSANHDGLTNCTTIAKARAALDSLNADTLADDTRADAVGRKIAEALSLKEDREEKGRYRTTWGTKTPAGLARTLALFLSEA